MEETLDDLSPNEEIRSFILRLILHLGGRQDHDSRPLLRWLSLLASQSTAPVRTGM